MKTDFYEIRRLLSLWYDGLTTPEQELLLIQSFGELPHESVPEDLKPDHAIFSNLQPQVSVPAIEAERAVEKAIRHTRTPLFPKITRRAISIASIAAILIATAVTITLLRPALQLSSPFSSGALAISDYSHAKINQNAEASDTLCPEPVKFPAVASRPMSRKTGTKKRLKNTIPLAADEIPSGYKTPSPEDASLMIAESWELMASLLMTTVDDASATAEAATQSASHDIQNAITTSSNSIEQFHDITANIINSL